MARKTDWPAETSAGAAPPIDAQAWQTLFITSVAIFLAGMDVTIVGIALPGISSDFTGASSSELAWVFTSYNITFAALLLLGGRLGDRIGYRRAFLAGAAVFALASLLAAVAPSVEVLICGRVLQGVGSAIIYPSSLALLLGAFPVERRSLALGVWGAMAGLGSIVAPTLGALLVEWAGWRGVFVVNLPFVAAAAVRGWMVLRDGGPNRAMSSFDPVAVPLAAVGVAAMVLGIVQAEPWGWTDLRTIGCFVAAAVLLVAFVVRSRHHPSPLLDLELFRIRSFTVGNVVQVVGAAPLFGWVVLMPSFFQEVWGWSPLAAGVATVPSALVGALLSPLAGRRADRLGHRHLVAAGCVIGAVGPLWWVLLADEQQNYLWGVMPGLALAGVGAAACVSTTTGAIMSRLPTRYYSMGGAARTTIYQLGLGVGIAIAVSIVNAGDHLTIAPYRTVWAIATVSSLVAAVLMITLFPGRPRPSTTSRDA
jgi:EmrB/QacA subfamily drug resistance transporter